MLINMEWGGFGSGASRLGAVGCSEGSCSRTYIRAAPPAVTSRVPATDLRPRSHARAASARRQRTPPLAPPVAGPAAGSSPLPFHGVDSAVDALSPNEGKQRYEKMISGMYLGELARQLLLQLATAGEVFVAADGAAPTKRGLLSTPWALRTDTLAEIAEDTSNDLAGVGRALEAALKIAPTTVADRSIAQQVAALVARRAARLAAVGVSAVLTQMAVPAGEGVNVAIDGSVFKKYPHFAEWMAEALSEMGAHPGLVVAEDGSGLGAALVAAVALGGGAVRART